MTLWFGVALMTASAIFAVLWPLLRAHRVVPSGSEIAAYEDRLAEIERDRAVGLIGQPEANAAVVEVSRRLLAAACPLGMAMPQAGAAAWRRGMVIAAALFAMPLGTLTLYLAVGSPGLPAQPLPERVVLGTARTPLQRSADCGFPLDEDRGLERTAMIWRDAPGNAPPAGVPALTGWPCAAEMLPNGVEIDMASGPIREPVTAGR